MGDAMAEQPSAMVIGRRRRPRFLALLAVVLALAGGVLAPGARGQDASREATPNDPELLFWQSIMNSKSAGDYQAYLQTYPRGNFVPLAKARLQTLGAVPAASTPGPAPAAAVDVAAAMRQGLTAYQRSDYATAMTAFRGAADAGNLPAKVMVGELYYLGRGVPQDFG
jgi:TPR repeat protein